MRIHTKTVWEWIDGEYQIVEEQGYEYAGAIAECKGGGGQTVDNDPWSGIQPYLRDVYGSTQDWYQGGGADFYPGQTYVDMSDPTVGAMDATMQRAVAGNTTMNATNDYATEQMQGGYLNSNPYLNEMTQGLTDNFNESVVPGLNAMFSLGGRTGNNMAKQTQAGIATDSLAQGMGELYYNNYSDERDRMQQTAALAPQIAQQDYNDIAAVYDVGSRLEDQAGNILASDMDRYDFSENKEYNDLVQYMNLIMGAGIPGSTTTSSGGGSVLGNMF
jgi:hypothetical protein